MTVKKAHKKSIVLVGLMGAGKTKIGRILANHLELPFIDADNAIEEAAGCSVSDIFEWFGEKAFRDGEKKVMHRLLTEEGQHVIATGGGAFIAKAVRDDIKKHAVSIWLKADLETLIERTSRSDRRPLLQTSESDKILKRLMDERYPIYAQADIHVESSNRSIRSIIKDIETSLEGTVIF